jgi:hypothetical protein
MAQEMSIAIGLHDWMYGLSQGLAKERHLCLSFPSFQRALHFGHHKDTLGS